ncbi:MULTISPECIES: response regulator transcription factor [Alphaproteobacteria]|uniref:DNA-binding response regulator n=2 Tax=Alphaproteobacteria TaxID=28211 RepID=A0A512HHA6_9HYPH|nr:MULTISPECIES: response regulator transcription factor [Alphaproteobacteria]GEO84829.1 DNA-binding response regulator [Ciceribacter naphthalenivorans]GLR20550.1 DNA-binding response regulator [Ciceribacter naphthalenivorans]GLT03406.1 DNA-binding response regulator [Sphingomonas psychrolutea]
MRFLLVEDTQDVAEAIRDRFVRGGHVIDIVGHVADAEQLSAFNMYDLVILDVNLPDGSGFDLLKRLRLAKNTVPVLVLTARLAVDDKISALDIGADDYMVKPFDLGELEARVRAIIRRRAGGNQSFLEAGNLTFDMVERRTLVAGEERELTRREQMLLEIFLTNSGRVLEKEDLLVRLFGLNGDSNPNAVEVYVGRLRRKIEGSDLDIRTLRGLGYQARLTVRPDS